MQPESQPESLEAKLIALLAGGSMAKAELSKSLGQKELPASSTSQLNKVVRRLLANRMIEYTLPDKPRSRLQQYRLTDRGRVVAATLARGNAEP